MAALDYFVNPFELKQLLTKLGSQVTVADALDAVEADILAKITNDNPCPRCLTQGRTAGDKDACTVCYGKAYTIDPVTSPPRTFTPVSPVPDVTP